MPRLLLTLLFALGWPLQSTELKPLEGPELQAARALVTRVASKMKGVQRLHGDFVQEQHTLLLDTPLISKGRLHLRAKPGCLLLELSEPKRVLVRSDEHSHQVYRPGAKRAERYLFESNELAKSLLAILTADISKIEQAFVINGHSANEEHATLELRLRDPEKRKFVDQLKLVVSPSTAELQEISFTNRDGERTLMRLSKLRRVKADSPEEERLRESEVFDAKLPADVKLVIHAVPAASAKD